MKQAAREVFISVDVECSGPIPGEFSMLTIGACLVTEPSRGFEARLKPINANAHQAALDVTGLSPAELAETGTEPAEAMRDFADWVHMAAGTKGTPVFVGFNAPFDWSFVNYYFLRFTGENPFGFTALDIKAFWMGVSGCSWSDTKSSQMAEHLSPASVGNHDALQDARYQAELFRLALQQRSKCN